jgi:hypothetical protein
MVIGYIIVGMISGAILAVMGLIAGSSLWSAFLLYTVGGWLTTLGLAGLVYILPRKSAVPDDKVGSVAPKKVEV